MKRFMVFALSLTLIMVLGFMVMAGDNSLDKIREKGKFVVGLDDTFAPMGFRDEEGNLVGFDIDLARVTAERMGVEVEFKPVDWDGVILSLRSGMIDVIWNGLTITEERAKQINFTDPYMNNRQVIVVQMNSPIQTKADLAGKVVGLQMGSSSVNALYSDPELVQSLKDIRQYATNAEALMDLQIGRLDAVVVDEMHGRYYYISKKPDVYRVLDEELDWEQYGVGVRKEDESFLAELNRVLDELKADGTAEELSIKWFGENVID
jgi:polar amino acid transport system substrate-binding protein